MPEKFTLAGVQMDPFLMDKEANLARMIDSVEQAVAKQSRLVVFPECALTGYCFESLQEALPYAETIPGPSTERLAGVCRKAQVYLVLGMLEKDGDRCFNAAALIGPEGVVGKYRKVPSALSGRGPVRGLRRSRFRGPPDPPGRIGLNICYDGSFPESARTLALNGADVILLPTNWPTGAEAFAEFLVNARGLENHVFSVAVNRVGRERGFRFIGRSRIANPSGRTLALASPDGGGNHLRRNRSLGRPRQTHHPGSGQTPRSTASRTAGPSTTARSWKRPTRIEGLAGCYWLTPSMCLAGRPPCRADYSRKNGRSLMKMNHEWTPINTNRPEDR